MNWTNLVTFEVPSTLPHVWWDYSIPAEHQVAGREFRLRYDGLEADELTVISLQLATASHAFGAGTYVLDGLSAHHNGENALVYVAQPATLKDTGWHLPLPGGEGFQLRVDIGEWGGNPLQWTGLGARGEARFRSECVVSGQTLKAVCEIDATFGEWGYGPGVPGHRRGRIWEHGYWEGAGALTGLRVTPRSRGATGAKLVFGRLAVDVLV